MKTLYKLKEMLWAELDEYAEKKELSAGDIEPIHKLTDTIKNICKIDRMTNEMGGTSHSGGTWTAEGKYGGMGGAYSGRNRHYVSGHYSYDDAKKKIYHELGEAAELATTQRERDIINRAMREIENA